MTDVNLVGGLDAVFLYIDHSVKAFQLKCQSQVSEKTDMLSNIRSVNKILHKTLYSFMYDNVGMTRVLLSM